MAVVVRAIAVAAAAAALGGCIDIPEHDASHDEDGDQIVDGEDLCPHLPSAQDDTDGDGIGNECDLAGGGADTAYFFPMTAIGMFTVRGNATLASDGDAVLVGPSQPEATGLTIDLPGDELLVDAMIAAVEPTDTEGVFHEGGVVVAGDFPAGDLCVVGEIVAPPMEVGLEENDGTAKTFHGSVDLEGIGFADLVNLRMRVLFTRDTALNCSVSAPVNASVDFGGDPERPTRQGRGVGLTAVQAQFRVTSMFVVSR
jgi:hypothetical protein